MKKLFTVSLFFLPLVAADAQVDMGAIPVCSRFTATLLFPAEIEFVIFGNNPMAGMVDDMPEYENYALFQHEKTLILKANKENIPSTSINVKTTDGTLWYGFIENRENTTLFYDFTRKSPMPATTVPETVKPSDAAPAIDQTETYKKKLNYLMEQSIEYKNLGLISGKLIFMVSNIMNDTENMYLKVIIQNQSGNAFEINSVVFKHVEGKTRGLKKNQVQNEERVMPVFEKSVNLIEAYSKHELGYVLPLFSTGKDGKFIIQFVENRGTRNYQIELSARDMQKIKVFNL